jgi:hypothetical protein
MTHPKNYEYVKKWRTLNRDKYMEIQKQSSVKRNNYKQTVKELLRISPILFQ